MLDSTTPAAPEAMPSWVPRDLYPFTSRYLDLEGHRLHYLDEGSGPTLLLLHGNPMWSFLGKPGPAGRQVQPIFGSRTGGCHD